MIEPGAIPGLRVLSRFDSAFVGDGPRGRGVELWSVLLDRVGDDWARLYDSLSNDEKLRADRMRFDRDRRRFVVARFALRETLARHLDTPAREVRFRYGPQGKPEIEGHEGLHFNVSHSRDLAIIAVAPGCRVGVDVEFVFPGASDEFPALGVLSQSELSALQALP